MEWFIVFTLIAVAVVFIVKKAGQRPKQKETPVLTVTEQVGFGGIGASGKPTSNQWRLRIQGISYLGFLEIEMKDGGADQCNGGTASNNKHFFDTPDKVFDNDLGTPCLCWPEDTGDGVWGWFQYTFPTAVSVSSIVVTSNSDWAPTTIVLQYYNGIDWVSVQVWTVTWSGTETKTLTV